MEHWDALLDACAADPDVAWGVSVVDIDRRTVVAECGADQVLRTASVGKLLLLLAVAEDIELRALEPEELLDRCAVEWVGDSGLWRHLTVEVLPLVDVASLVGAVSDNLATNVLLHRVGLARVDALASGLGLTTVRLLDQVRDRRDPALHPPTLSTGSAGELARLVVAVEWGEGAPVPEAWERAREWLERNADLSMVASGLRLDPLAHVGWPHIVNKTGSDDGIRADVGAVSAKRRRLAYAVVANWDPGNPDLVAPVMDRMRRLGLALRAELGP
jgi:beta-lactamase class A